MKNASRLTIVLIVASLIIAWLAFDAGRFFSLEYLKTSQHAIAQWTSSHQLAAVSLYSLLYILVTALSLPGAAIMTLAGGLLFGTFWGTVIVSFASTIGATLAFIIARYLLHDTVQARFGDRLQAINEGVRKDGAFYLFGLRLVPVFPFFLINLLMALTPISTRTFYWVSQLGMLPGTIVYVYAGSQLARVQTLDDIFSPGLLGAFALLGLFPLLAKKMLQLFRNKKIYSHWEKPKSFDRNLIVIGGGAAGLVTAYIGSALKAKVTLIERDEMGGDCLNTGCVPSKALICSANFLHAIKKAKHFGVKKASVEFEFSDIMSRVKRIIQRIEPHDSKARYEKLGVEVLTGSARLTSPWSVLISDGEKQRTLTSRAIVIATGARPFMPPVTGIEQVNPLTSDTIWSLQALPQRLLVLGGGPIGCELAQAFARLGAKVTLVEMLPRLLIKEDEDVSCRIEAALRKNGVRVLTSHKAIAFSNEHENKALHAVPVESDTHLTIEFDEVLVAVGRRANTDNLGLEELNIILRDNGTIKTNEYLQTTYPNIYAAGDVTGPYQFTHTAAHQAWYCAVNALLDPLKKFRADYRVIPWATFTSPEVARVGLNEAEATACNIDHEVTVWSLDELDRAIIDETAEGFIKVITRKGSDKILGVTIVGENASEVIAEYVLAMRHNLGLNKILGTIHIYPTIAEANKYAAGEWKKAHAPEKLLEWAQRFHAWRRR